MKRLLLVLGGIGGLALVALAQGPLANWTIPGARTAGWQGGVLQQAVQTGTDASGNPIMTPVISTTASGVVVSSSNSYVTTSGTIPAGTQSYSLTVTGTNTATITSGSIALNGAGPLTQWYKGPLSNGNTYPAVPFTVSGSAILSYEK